MSTDNEQVTYGHIDETTPIGRRFEIEDADAKYAMTLVARDGERLQFAPDVAGAELEWMSVGRWNASAYARLCVGYTDPVAAAVPVDAPASGLVWTDDCEKMVSNQQHLSDDDWKCLQKLNALASERERTFNSLKEETSAAKKRWEASQEEVADFICDRTVGSLPLFDIAATDTDDESGESAETPEPAQDSEAWRTVRLDSLAGPAISPRYLNALAENNPPIATIGELADWQALKGDFWAKDISGMGKVGQDELADATGAYWSRGR